MPSVTFFSMCPSSAEVLYGHCYAFQCRGNIYPFILNTPIFLNVTLRVFVVAFPCCL